MLDLAVAEEVSPDTAGSPEANAFAQLQAREAVRATRELGPAEQAGLLREVVGDPFRAGGPLVEFRYGLLVSFCPWMSQDAFDLAQRAHDERSDEGGLDPVRLSILADALEEAGCDDARLLSHLRAPGPHVWGCWVVDLVRGKS